MGRCAACREGGAEVELFEAFDGIFYCKICMQKYHLPIPEEKEYKINDEWEIL
jgi:hypothetical protein